MNIWDKYKWDIWNPATQPLKTDSATVFRKISLCTTCMNRAHDLKVTLPENIGFNLSYPNLEIVVLNYNSSDDLHEFMFSSPIYRHIRSGLIKYARTKTPSHYSMAHSRNIAFRIASGDIVLNVDADNFTGPNFAQFVNRLAEIQPSKAVFSKGKRMIHGRVGMYKNEFLAIGGYDEDLVGYGYDDTSLMARAIGHGCRLMWWGGLAGTPDFSKRIKTPRSDITKNMLEKDWHGTESRNKEITFKKLDSRQFEANKGRVWGYVPDLTVAL